MKVVCLNAYTHREHKIYRELIVCRSWVKGASVLVVLLGLTWTFGVLFLGGATMVFAYIFTILNSLQGLFIFVFHCAMNEKVILITFE